MGASGHSNPGHSPCSNHHTGFTGPARALAYTLPVSHSLLIVDDDSRVRTALSEALESETLNVRTAANAEAALDSLGEHGADLVLADLRMPGMDGLTLLRRVKERDRDTSVILMTAYEDLSSVATAMRDGAVDFLIKPLDLPELRRTLQRVLEDQALARGSVAGTRPRPRPIPEALFVGRHPAMIEVFKLVGQAAAARSTVLIRGASGTGKELIARSIHALSPRAASPFVAVNCASIPESLLESELFGHVRGAFTDAVADRKGRFALARDGTLLLDEIGDTSTEFQAKLLRVLQEGEYTPVGTDRPLRAHARILAATHQDLEDLVERDEFRRDLYYRLRVVEIYLPPLAERAEDIPLLVEHLLERKSRAAGRPAPVVSSDSMALLIAHDWPGNVRELENCLERAMITAAGDVIRPEHLPTIERRAAEPKTMSLNGAEREHIRRVLESTGGNKSRAASTLEISRPRLDRLIRKYGLSRPPE